MWLKAFFFLIALYSCTCEDRKLKSYLNPGCEQCKCTLVHTQCDEADRTVHHLWDFTRGRPSLFVSVTSVNTTLTVLWAEEKPSSFIWTEQPKYSFAVVLDKILEYNDLNDTAVWSPEATVDTTRTRNLVWTRAELIQDPTHIKLRMKADKDIPSRSNGSISVELELTPSTDVGHELPHLVHSGNSSLASVSLADFSRGAYNSSRLALELILAASDAGDVAEAAVSSLDDEHTPGIFRVVNLVTPETVRSGDGGFVQFRPVAYTAPVREVTASTIVSAGNVTELSRLPADSTLRRFYDAYPNGGVLKNGVVISLGGSGDGFYRRTNYTAWAFTAGYGAPPVEGFSLYVLLVIAIGLAVPTLLLLGGCVYMLACRRRRGGHQRLRD